jgi:hypothetical protein
MRQERRMAAPALPPAPVRTATEPPTSGYVLVVDGQMKAEFKMKDGALKAARDLKNPSRGFRSRSTTLKRSGVRRLSCLRRDVDARSWPRATTVPGRQEGPRG